MAKKSFTLTPHYEYKRNATVAAGLSLGLAVVSAVFYWIFTGENMGIRNIIHLGSQDALRTWQVWSRVIFIVYAILTPIVSCRVMFYMQKYTDPNYPSEETDDYMSEKTRGYKHIHVLIRQCILSVVFLAALVLITVFGDGGRSGSVIAVIWFFAWRGLLWLPILNWIVAYFAVLRKFRKAEQGWS